MENEQLKRIEEKLDLLLQKFDCLEPECKKMGNHIDFVEGVYDTVKAPMNLLCNKINSYVGNSEQLALPDSSGNATSGNTIYTIE